MQVVPPQLPVSQPGGSGPTWRVASRVTTSLCSMGRPPEQMDTPRPSALPGVWAQALAVRAWKVPAP